MLDLYLTLPYFNIIINNVKCFVRFFMKFFKNLLFVEIAVILMIPAIAIRQKADKLIE
jgi:hypothetical protein